MKWYAVNLLEAASQLFNALHAGDANQTFSARTASYRGNPDAGWYWTMWISIFNFVAPDHLDWAEGPD